MVQLPSLADVEEARGRVRGSVLRTPLVPLRVEDAPAEVHLKLENLQPTGSFKVRGAGNAVELLPAARRSAGVYTCSAGNMAQALAYHAKRVGVRCTAIVPDTAPETKLAGLRRLGAAIVQLPWDEVWEIAETKRYAPLEPAAFVHPFSDPAMIAGNGTIGLEILEDLPDAAAVVVPFGGGGLACGIAAAMKAKRAGVRAYACEVETAAPLAASLKAGRLVRVERVPSFVDAIGGSNVVPEMWDLARAVLDGSIVVSVDEAAAGVRLLAERNRVIGEGASGTAVAAALSGKAGPGRVVAIVSGGNIDGAAFAAILRGETPRPPSRP
jgi:threonine dehydratase